ncbi:unnamed protein product [Leuciscus chuanchicus]
MVFPYRFLQKFLQKETELLKSGKANVSATTQANRQKKMQEISSLMKYFIRCANQRGPKLKCAELLSHVVEVLQNQFSCGAYGEDYSSILLKDVLSVRKYWCEMSQQQWHSAHAEDWVKWQGQLCALYDALVSEISQIGSRGKYATDSRHIAVKENLIELTADVCHQLFSQSTHVQEVTSSVCRDTQRDSPQSCKRRRIEQPLTNWEGIRSKLQPHHSDFDIIPWLQVAATLISRYPWILPVDELVPLLGLLCQLQGEQQRRGERGPYVLRCLRELALCHATGSSNTSAHTAELARLWARVWALALRGVGSAQTGTLSLELLRTIVQESLEPVDREFWKVFSELGLSLAQALLKCSVPKSVHSRDVVSGVLMETGGEPPTLRDSVISWLLMNEHNEETEENCRPHLIITRDFPLNLIPRILVSLTLKDSRAGLTFLMGSLKPESFSSQSSPLTEAKDTLGEVESVFLQFSFDDTPPSTKVTADGDGVYSEKPQFTVIPALRSKLELSLLSVAEQLFNCYSPDSSNTPHECVLRCASLLTGVLAAYVCMGLLTEEEACCSPLFIKAKHFLPQVEEFKYLGVLYRSEGRMEREIDRRIGAASAVKWSMYRSVVVKPIDRSIYVPTLTYGHELWVMTKRTRSRTQAAEMSFLRRVAGRSLRDRVRSSVTREELRVEPLLLHIERGQLRWLWHLFRMPPGRLPGKVFRARPTGRRPRGRPRTRWRDYVSRLAWERLGVPPEELEEVSREREVWASLLRLLPPRPGPG